MDWNEIGKGDSPCQNPPELSQGDRFIWSWYFKKSTGYIQDFSLMPMLLEKLNLDESDMELFLFKLNLIHQTIYRIQREDAKKENA